MDYIDIEGYIDGRHFTGKIRKDRITGYGKEEQGSTVSSVTSYVIYAGGLRFRMDQVLFDAFMERLGKADG